MAFRLRSTCLIAALAITILTAGGAQAQDQPDPNLKPTYGAVTLKAGFLPDPFKLDLVAGGQIKSVQRDATIYCAKAPDFSLNYTKGEYTLFFHAGSTSGGTFLLINLPDGKWVSDGALGRNPVVRVDNPQSGRYDIFVGAVGKNLTGATLLITERTEGVAESLRAARKFGAVPKEQPQTPAKVVQTTDTVTQANTGSALSTKEADDLVRRHNEIRGELRLPEVKWSPDLARSAQQWADEIARTGDVKHGGVGANGQHYGQNLYWAFGGNLRVVDAANSWYHEKGAYVPGTPVADLRAGHYTQMIWRATNAIGCGKATIQTGTYRGWVVIVCDYNPPGNYLGQVAENSK